MGGAWVSDAPFLVFFCHGQFLFFLPDDSKRKVHWCARTHAAVNRCVAAGVPLVVDADGLWLIAQRPQLVAGGGHKVLLTPNAAEFKRLRDRVLPPRAEAAAPSGCAAADARAALPEDGVPEDGGGAGLSVAAAAELRAVSAALGVAVLLKGQRDAVVGPADCSRPSNGASEQVLLVVRGEAGSPRRSGGTGDLLAGAATVFFTWAHRTSPPDEASVSASSAATAAAAVASADEQAFTDAPLGLAAVPPALWAAWAACVVVKRSAAVAFGKHGRSTTAPDVLAEVGPEAGKLFPLEP